MSYLIFEKALVRHLLLTPRYWISINVHRGVKISWYFSPICPNTKCLNGNWMNLNEICWIWKWLVYCDTILYLFIEISLKFWNFSSYLFELMCTLPFYIGAIMSVFWKTQNEINYWTHKNVFFMQSFLSKCHWTLTTNVPRSELNLVSKLVCAIYWMNWRIIRDNLSGDPF